MSSVLLFTIFQVASHNHHVFRQLKIDSRIMGSHGLVPTCESLASAMRRPVEDAVATPELTTTPRRRKH